MSLLLDMPTMFADFGIDATVNGAPVRGIFDNGFADVYGMDGAKPSLQCASADVATAVRGTAVVVNAVNYKVYSHEDDGTGMTILRLEKA